jgi:hypothetical protein
MYKLQITDVIRIPHGLAAGQVRSIISRHKKFKIRFCSKCLEGGLISGSIAPPFWGRFQGTDILPID